MQGSAPEVVGSLAPLWADLSDAEQTRLAWSWVDRSVRELLPLWFDRLGLAESARRTRTQARIVDARSARLARRLLLKMLEVAGSSLVGASQIALQGGLLSSLSLLRRDVSEPSEACLMFVMTSRHVFGDDRALKELLGPRN